MVEILPQVNKNKTHSNHTIRSISELIAAN